MKDRSIDRERELDNYYCSNDFIFGQVRLELGLWAALARNWLELIPVLSIFFPISYIPLSRVLHPLRKFSNSVEARRIVSISKMKKKLKPRFVYF